MSTEKQSWIDHLGLPSDDFTWIEGSDGLDGFSEDAHSGQSDLVGPMVSAQTKGLSALPDDLVSSNPSQGFEGINLHDETDGLNLSQMLSEGEGALHQTPEAKQAASLMDLDWLDPTQEQDPSRLPKPLRPDEPPLNSSPELEEAWGVNRRTNGLSLVPNRDKVIAEYEAAVDGQTPGVGKAVQDTSWHIKKAIRLSHYGESLQVIGDYLQANLDEPSAKKAYALIAADHGLSGHVFVRANAFTGLKNGKWLKELRKFARTARYVITDDALVASKLGMQMVSTVPWKAALAHYRPLLKVTGHRVASVAGSPKKTLQLAILRGPKKVEHNPSQKPVDIRPSDSVSVADATAAMKAAPRKPQEKTLPGGTAKARMAALALVDRAMKSGLLPEAEGLRLKQSKASPESIRRSAEILVRTYQAPKTTVYGGQIMKEHQPSSKDPGIRVAELRAMATWLRQQMSEGMAGDNLTALMGLRFASPLREAGTQMVQALRSQHEGLSGHLYVDAAAYASKSGTSGCSKAASLHRANQIRYVQAMERCGGCSLVNANGVCTKYGKELLTQLPKSAKSFQQKMIHQADAPDQEITAALFNPNEFGLESSGDVDVDEPEITEGIGDVFFGGMTL